MTCHGAGLWMPLRVFQAPLLQGKRFRLGLQQRWSSSLSGLGLVYAVICVSVCALPWRLQCLLHLDAVLRQC